MEEKPTDRKSRFPWNIVARSVDAMFSGGAMKHILKFVVKMKLGKFILGDIDLDQLELQILSGTAQLTDLALNVDYINQKLGSLPVKLKEGSIGSLLAKISWSGSSCQIEVDELELVFVPCVKKDISAGAETSSSSEGCKQPASAGSEKRDHESTNHSSTAVSFDVHEGVKTIAKIVKWLLTSFHIKVKKLIVAYDPYSDMDKTLGSHKSLVLRIRELEYGTSVSEESNARSASWVDSLLGMSKLTNFIKFEGATVEFLQMCDVENQKHPTRPPGDPEMMSGDWSTRSVPLEATTPILTGEGGGFSGNLKLSIPWRNGSLDIHKVDADVSVDPIDLRLDLNTITWFLCSWQYLKNLNEDTHGHMHDNSSYSVYFNTASQFNCSNLRSGMVATHPVSTKGENFSTEFLPQTSQETSKDALFRGSHVISNWLALSTNLGPNGGAEAEPDLSASVEQFFECFDGLRTSHSPIGNSGILNWTRSYFSAVTAASSLASGSLLLPSEQQAVETNFRASFSGISVELDLCNKYKKYTCGKTDNSIKGGQNAHYLGAKCGGLLVVLQVCPRETKFEATIQHMELVDYFNNANEDANSGLSSRESTIYKQSLSILDLQAEVQGALPPFSLLQDLDSTAKTRHDLRSFSSHPDATTKNISSLRPRTAAIKDFVKMELLKTSSVTPCQFTMNMAQLDGTKTSSTSFSVRLPPFVFWLNFSLVNSLLDFLKEIENSIETKKNEESGFGDLNERFKSSAPGNVKGTTSTGLSSSSSKRRLRGNIFLSNARIILCFPSENALRVNSYFRWHQFVGLDITPASSKENFVDACLRDASLPSTFSDKVSGFIYLNFENLKMHLIVGSASDAHKKPGFYKHAYFAQEIISVTTGTKCFSCIGVLWQDGPVTGPWVATMARELATSQDSIRSRTRVTGKGAEFASVTTMRDQDYTSSYTQELILSSTFLLHIRLPSVSVKLTSSQYQLLHRLCDQIMSDLSRVDLNAGSASSNKVEKEITSTSQTSILVECNSVEILTNLDKLEGRKCSLHTELAGSWHKLKLQIQKVELLSVSNIGGVHGSKFFWFNHGEGELRGSVDEFSDQELLLISCSDSTMQRGDGEGANALSSGSSGTLFVWLLDPEILQSFTTVTISGGTIIAPGGRLDWLNAICNFFNLPSKTELESHDSDLDGSSEDSGDYQSSFVFNMVDIALSYESWKRNLLVIDRVYESDSSGYVNASENCGDHVACLLAVASLNLSNQTVTSSKENEYKIRLQDLGLLLCESSGPRGGNIYDVEYLHKAGYVKVAGEALVEAVMRTNCKSGLLWELECYDSHINLDTCHDTTSGLVRLAAQLQKLFAPDLEESMVHLQSRWKAVQQVNCSNDFTSRTDTFDGCSSSLPNQPKLSGQDVTGSSKPSMVGLMDDICEDAFQFDINCTRPSESGELQSTTSLDISQQWEAYPSKVSDHDYFSHHVFSAIPQAGRDNIHKVSPQTDCFPKVIEGYYLSALCPISEIPTRNHSINKPKCGSKKQNHADVSSSGWYNEKSLNIVENHIPKVCSQPEAKEIPEKYELPPNNCRSPDDTCKARGKVLLKNIDVRWRMYGGSYWHGSTKNGQSVGRDTSVCLEFKLSSMDLQYEMYPDDEVCMSKLALSVKDFNLYDHSRDAPWKLILGYYHSKDHPRESSAKAFKLDLEAVRPDPSTPLEEYRLRLAFLPILLHLDQDQLDFLLNFFGEKEVIAGQSTIDECSSGMSATNSSKFGGNTISDEALLPFFQNFDIWPIVFRVDYSPRRVDLAALRRGNYVHLINLVPWKGIELKLKHVHAVGIYGWNSVCETIVGEWLEDISHNQVHKFLRGLPPVRSLFTVGSGAAKLVSLPVKNYRKDHKLMKGIQRGAIAFLRSISLEAIGLGVHLAAGAHDVLLQTEYIFTSVPPSVSSPARSKRKPNVRSNQPKDAQQGIQQAYESLSDGLGKSASALVGYPLKTYQRGGGAGSALASAVCAAPAAAIAPASAAVRAVHCALMGVRNSLDPEHKKESMEKYLGTAQPPKHN